MKNQPTKSEATLLTDEEIASAIKANISIAVDQILNLWWMADNQADGNVISREHKAEVMRRILLDHLGIEGIVNATGTY